MRQLLIFFFIFLNIHCLGCKACNIHNYLYGSIKAADIVYKGVVIKEIDDYNAQIKVIEVLKNTTNIDITHEKLLLFNLSSSENYVGDTLIFNNSGEKFARSYDVLSQELEWEVRFLIDSNSVKMNTTNALKMLEGVSRYTNTFGEKYLNKNYTQSFDSITQYFIRYRNQCIENPKIKYGKHIMFNYYDLFKRNLTSSTKAFLYKEILKYSELKSIDFSLAYRGYYLISPLCYFVNKLANIQENFRYEIVKSKKKIRTRRFLKSPQYFSFENQNFQDSIKEFYWDHITNKTAPINAYFSFALAKDYTKKLKKIVASEKQESYITWGFVIKLEECRDNYRSETAEKLEKIIIKRTTNERILDYVLENYKNQ